MKFGVYSAVLLASTLPWASALAQKQASDISVTRYGDLLQTSPVPIIRPKAVITLEQAYDRTLATDQSVQTAYIQIKRAHLDLLTAYTKILPNINGSAVRTWISSPAASSVAAASNSAAGIVSGGIGTSSGGATSYNSLGVVLQQPLLDLSFFPARRLGIASQTGARYDYREQIRVVLMGVAQGYYNVLSDERLVEEDKLALKLAEEQRDLSQKQANVGLVTETDVLNAVVVVETAKETLVADVNTLASDRNILANTLNLPPDMPYSVMSPPDYTVKIPAFPAALAKALACREDLQSKEQAIKHDIELRKEALMEYTPKVNAQIEGFRSNQVTTDRYANEWQASLTLTIPIFNAGQREIDVKSATYQLEQTKLARDTVAKTVEQDVKTAWLALRTLTETLEALRSQVKAAEKSYNDLLVQYKAGISTSVDVLVALNTLNLARRTLAQETFALQVALRKLEQVSGTFQENRVNQAPYPLK